MEVLDRAPAVSSDGRAVVFVLSIRGREVEGVVARDVLEEHFWLPRDADARRTLRTFKNGRNRIVAVAQRKFTGAARRTVAADRQRLPDPLTDRWRARTGTSVSHHTASAV
ncbi:DUF1488 family protein [Paraburkholderia sp. SIMBA_030]|uniref:DUF1488 family protein n=1 Tax=Paraburkholderia sp. SIMBA_030 TaxID=3085773 RepID=UPI003978D5E7